MTRATPQQLFNYADRFARKAEGAGRGTQYPTVQQAARRFKCPQSAIEEAAGDYIEGCYLGLATVGIPGVGSWTPRSLGEWMVEAYRDLPAEGKEPNAPGGR